MVENLLGLTFGRLSVVGEHKRINRNTHWACRCSCGKTLLVFAGSLKRGVSKSCGCLKAERNRTHGLSHTPAWTAWKNMRARCKRKTHRSYPDYGGRGITVCERWDHSFESFLADMGHPPSAKHTLERNDNSKGYGPDNCRWATRTDQCLNKRDNRLIEYQGETHPLMFWCRKLGMTYGLVIGRLNRGWTAVRAFSAPQQSKYLRKSIQPAG